MSRLLEGTDGFRYVYISVRRDIPIQDLARVSRAGALRFVVDHYSVWMGPKENDLIYLEQLEDTIGVDPDPDRGFYEAEEYDTTAKALFEQLVRTELEQTVPEMIDHFGDELQELYVIANIQFRLDRNFDWERMLAYLNSVLPEELRVTLEELGGFDNYVLAEYDPEKHEARREDGTLFLRYLLENDESEGLAYLAFRILSHAVQHDLEILDVDDEPRWQSTLYVAEGDEDEGDEDEEDEDEEDDDDEQ